MAAPIPRRSHRLVSTQIPAPTHRVVADFDDDDRAPRLAATFFCEPRADARMADVAGDTSDAPTYETWRARSYKKYLKKP